MYLTSLNRPNDPPTSSLHAAVQANSTLDKSLISKPRATSLLTVLDDPFKLENPYPVHTYESKQAPADITVTSTEYRKEVGPPTALTSSSFGESRFPSLLPPPPFSAASYTSAALSTGSSTSLYSQMSVQESLASADSFSPLIPPPSLLRDERGRVGMHAPSTPISSSSSVNQISRGRSTGPGSVNVQRPFSMRARSSSRSRSASISSPPTGPLPDPPPEVPSTPTTVTDTPRYSIGKAL